MRESFRRLEALLDQEPWRRGRAALLPVDCGLARTLLDAIPARREEREPWPAAGAPDVLCVSTPEVIRLMRGRPAADRLAVLHDLEETAPQPFARRRAGGCVVEIRWED